MKKLSLFLISILTISSTLAQWKQTAGPLISSVNVGMDMSKVVVSGNNLCSIISGRIYLSTENGQRWMYASYGVPYVRSIAFSDSVIYAGTEGKGVYLSTNWGSTYAPINNGLPANGRVEDILIYGNELLASVYDGSNIHNVYYSIDNGSTWTAATGLNMNYTIYCLATNGTYLYAGTSAPGSGIYMSADSGHTWNSIGLANNSISSIAAYGNRLFAADDNLNGPLFFSQDNGAIWNQVNNSVGPPDVCSMAIDNNYIYAASFWNGVYYSNNNGSSWSALGLPCSGSINVEAIAVNGNYLYGGTGDGCAYSLNLSSWNCGGGIKNYNLNIRSIVSKGNKLMSGTGTGNFNSTYFSLDTGQTWNTILFSSNALAVGDSGVFRGGNGYIRRSRDWGTTWINVNIPGGPTIKNLDIKDAVGFAATSTNGIYYSANNGLNWTERNTGLSTLNFNAVVFTDSVVVAGSNNAGIFLSTDSGLNWNAASNGLADTCIQALAGFGNIIFAGTKNHGIYKSTDKGANWVQAYFGILDSNVTSLYTCGMNVFAGITGRGFLVSTDSGLTWSAYNTGLMNYNINSITANATNVFIGSGPPGITLDGGSVWKKNLSEMPLRLSVKEIDVDQKVICEGDASTISVIAIGGIPPYNYSWSAGNQTPSITVSPTTTTVYSVTVTDSQSNVATSSRVITVKPKPATPVLTQHGDTIFSNAFNGLVWLRNDTVIPFAFIDWFVPHEDGSYSVYVMENGCSSDTSNIIIVLVGIYELGGMNDIIIYPVPATNNINMNLPEKSTVELLSMNGQLLKSFTAGDAKTNVNIMEFPPGMYFIKIKTDKGILIKKFVKVN